MSELVEMSMNHGVVAAVSRNSKHGFSKQPQTAIELLVGLGVQGDAHCGATIQHVYLKRRNPDAPNRMQVHLLQSELLDELACKNVRIAPGELGENILTSGVDLLALPQGTRLRLGAHAIVEVTCLRQPCVQMDRFRPGLQREMCAAPGSAVRYRAGVMGIVIAGGAVQPGDRLECTLPAGSHRVLTT